MFKNMSRAIRRQHRARMIKKAMKYEIIRWWNCQIDTEEKRKKRATQLHNHLKPCSCYMCGNQRHNDWQNKTERLTIQERKELENYNNQIKELENA